MAAVESETVQEQEQEQEQEQKKKRRKKDPSIEKIFEWAKGEFLKAADLFHKRKYEIVLETARRLKEAGIESGSISTEISKGLEGIVTDRYVRVVLDDYPEYKNSKKAANAQGSGTIKAFRGNNSAEQSQNEAGEEESSTQNRATLAPSDLSSSMENPARSVESQPQPQQQQEQQLDEQENVEEQQDDSPYGSYQMPVEQYNINDVEQYDRLFLIQLVQYLHKRVQELS